MEGTLSMREAAEKLDHMAVEVETIIRSMNQEDSSLGGFEQHMYELRHHVSDATELLSARIYGQLAQNPVAPPYDKPLHLC